MPSTIRTRRVRNGKYPWEAELVETRDDQFAGQQIEVEHRRVRAYGATEVEAVRGVITYSPLLSEIVK